MSKLFPIPLYAFFQISSKNGGIRLSKLTHLLPWITKFIVFEPFRWMELAMYERRVGRHTITNDPLFILGHYRSGTTYLQRLLIQDKQFGYQTVFHSGLPEVMLGFEWLFKPLLTGITHLAGSENKFHKVPFTWDFPGEEDVALTAFGWKDALHWGNLFPKKMEAYFHRYVLSNESTEPIQAWKDNYLYFLKKLSIKNKGRRLVLKSPPHTARIPLLLEMFPKARFIHIYRDPYDVFASSRRFWNIINKYYALQPLNDQLIEQLIINTYKNIMGYYVQTKGLIPKENLIEVCYEELAASPLDHLEKLYDRLHLGDFQQVGKDAEKFVRSTQNYKRTSYQLSPEERLLIEKNWSEFLSLWKYNHQ